MAHKVSAGGSYRPDKRYSEPVGRLAIATGATTRAGFHNVVACCDRLDWPVLAKTWKGSTADWNHVRRAVSHILAVHLGDTFDPLRRAVVKAIPRQRERVPDLDVATFWHVVDAAPEHVRASFVVLVALGLRTGEYLRMRETDLHPITRTVSVPGSKTEGSAAVFHVANDLWPWVARRSRHPSNTSGFACTGSAR